MSTKQLTPFVLVALLTASVTYSQIDRLWHKPDSEINTYYRGSISERGAEAQHRAISKIEERISNLGDFSTAENVEYLAGVLRKLAMKNIFQVRERIEIYDQVQRKLLSIPSHARFFADSLEAQRDELEPGQYRGAYDTQRHWIIRQTLVHLPSPETVEVLGKYLFDERDDPPELWSPGQDAAPISGSGFLAMDALSKIGLRNPPVESEYSDSVSEDREMLETYRKWYENVKTGELSFSFVGQSVEYRFQPDGSVVSSPVEIPENEREEAGAATREPVRKDPAEKIDPEATLALARSFPWFWIGAVVLLVTALLGFVKLRKC